MSDDFFSDLDAPVRRAEDLAAHRRQCTASPCERCSRFACGGGCGGVVDERRRWCQSCRLTRDLIHLEREIVPPRFRDLVRPGGRLDALVRRPVRLPRDRIVAVLEGMANVTDPPWVVIVGPLRVGKTSLGVAMLAAWFCGQHAAQRDRVRGVRFVDALSLGLAREQQRLGSEAPLVADAIAASVLLLDDLGQEASRHIEVIRHVVRKRSDEMRPTWITTWMTREELAERYPDGGFVARVYESKRVQIDAPARGTA